MRFIRKTNEHDNEDEPLVTVLIYVLIVLAGFLSASGVATSL